MNICHIDVPRTGSTSIRGMLDLGSADRHQTIRQKIAKHGLNWMQDAYVFSFVRNPFPRMVSFWSITDGRDDISFHEFIMRRIVGDAKYVNPAVPNRIYWDYIFEPQSYFLEAPAGVLDFVGRFENYESGVRKVWEDLGLGEPNFQCRAAGNYDRDNWKDYYTPELVDIVREYYGVDFNRFDYSEDF